MPHAQARVADQGHAPGLPRARHVNGIGLLGDGSLGYARDHGGEHGASVRRAVGSVDDPIAFSLYHRVVRLC